MAAQLMPRVALLLSCAVALFASVSACSTQRDTLRLTDDGTNPDSLLLPADPALTDPSNALHYAHALLYGERYGEATPWIERAYAGSDSVWRSPPARDTTDDRILMARQVSAQTYVRLAWVVGGQERAVEALRRIDGPTREFWSMDAAGCLAMLGDTSDPADRLRQYAALFVRADYDWGTRSAALDSCEREWPAALSTLLDER